MNRLFLSAAVISGLIAAPGSAVRADEKSDFFESKIRPLLVDKCYGCHSAESGEIKGGLQLDNRAAVVKGGDSGPVIVAGSPAASVLMKAVKWDDENLRMPPEGKLSDEQIADLEKWIKDGAFDPREGEVVKSPIEQLLADAEKHWSFRPVRDPAVPQVGAAHPVDAFLLAKLKETQLDFATDADRRMLIRRASFDLLGVPPTFAEVESFVADASPDAYERLLDRLLADPRYGERWGRHWLDVTRYADTKGSIYHDEGYPHAHTYRDYVIRSFNEDKPYDRFLLEQLAADQLETRQDPLTLAAMGFIGIGRRKDGSYDDDTVDDTLDVIGRGLMGLTVSCARCHDHKLEPITTKDYYALFGIIRSSKEPDILPALPLEDSSEACEFVEKNRASRVGYVESTIKAIGRATRDSRSRLGDYLRTAHESGWKTIGEHKPLVELLKERKLSNGVYDGFVRSRKTWIDAHPEIFGPYMEFESGKPLLPPVPSHPLVADEFVTPATTIEEIAARYNRVFAGVHDAWWKLVEADYTRTVELAGEELELPSDKLQGRWIARLDRLEKERAIGDAVRESLRQALLDKDSPVRFLPEVYLVTKGFAAEESKAIGEFAQAMTAAAAHPGAPARAMAFVDAERIYNSNVYVRGNWRLQGPEAPRKFLTVLSSIAPEIYPKNRSGRLDLAHAVISPANPLTFRVIVNRVWLWHFGNGIVRTPSDFGFRGDQPTHPELLDHLTTWFLNHGQSIKQLHKYLMTSRAYRQSSVATAGSAGPRVDFENRLLWRFPMRQLEFEAYRDTVLAVTGLLNPARGGKPKPIAADDPLALRRTVYATVDRKALAAIFRSFDFPDPNFTAPQRTRSTLPPRALVLLNSPWILTSSKALAEQLKTLPDDSARIEELYRRVLQRLPTTTERARAAAFVAAYPENELVRPEVRDWQYGFGGFDEAAGKVADFSPLTAFTGKDWRATPKAADGKPIVVAVDAQGGDPGPGVTMGSIRRWTAPLDGMVNVTAELVHSDEKSEGVVGRLVSSRTGVLGRWEAKRNAVVTELANIEVRKGDTLDFIVAGIGENDGGVYRWAPSIKMPGAAMPGVPGMPPRWDARLDFADPSKPQPRLSPWEELAQVMLLSSEITMLE